MNYYLDVLKNYAVFTGRARRKEFWIFQLVSFLVGAIFAILDIVLGLYNTEKEGTTNHFDQCHVSV